MNKELLEILTPILSVVSTGLAGIIGVWFALAIKKIQMQIKEIDDEATRKLAQSVLQEAEEAIRTSVVATNQTLVDALKNSSNDGKLTPEEIKQAFQATYSKSIDLMGSEIFSALKDLKPDVITWINTKIEFYVNQFK
jgi:ribosome recycling factor